jgi:energy-coupling factor transporter ATP-binding protein EcfA2
MSQDLLANIYNAFDPFKPLPAGSKQYVDCREVRGDADVWRDLGKKIVRSQTPVCQLYTGHRGGGKSTELLKLQKLLEEQGCFVVYFAADEGDIDPEDAQYTDILLACTRHLLKGLKTVDSKPIADWLGDRWDDLKDLAQTEVKIEDLKLSVEQQITFLGKLTATIRAIPSQRQKIREKIDPATVTLLSALNEFLQDAKKNLPNGKSKLVVIADNLDRIVPVPKGDRTNHDEIFLDRAEQLRGLDCHIIYTVPISMVFSHRGNNLTDSYGIVNVLPMIMVQTKDGKVYPDGMAKLQEILQSRIQEFLPNPASKIFEPAALERLLLMSGGHVRNLMQLVQGAIDFLDDLPITLAAVRRSIAKTREQMRLVPEAEEWELLRQVAKTKKLVNEDAHRQLLFNRSILQYCESDAEGGAQAWYDVHPILKDTPEFKG